MTITTNYQKNKALMTDFHHVAALATRRKRVIRERIFFGVLGVLGLLCGILLFFVGEDVSEYAMAVLGTLAGVHFFVRSLFYYQYLSFFTRRRMIKEMDTITYTFEDEYVSVDTSLEHCENPYRAFQGIYESRHIFLLMLTNRVGYVIAKEDLSEQELVQFRALLEVRFDVPLIYYDV